MSDISVLSHEYKTASELSEALNRAVLALKKVTFGLLGADAIPPDQVRAGRERLAAIVDAIVATMAAAGGEAPAFRPPAPAGVDAGRRQVQRRTGPAPGAVGVPTVAGPRVPGALAARLRAQRAGELRYYLDDLGGLADRLRQDGALGTRDFELLDEVAVALDAETSSVFRRLMHT